MEAPSLNTYLYSRNAEGKVSLTLHKGQTAAWDSLKRYIFVISGTQGGKTSFGPWWLWREAAKYDFAGDYIAVSATFDLFHLKMLPEIRTVFEHVMGIGRWWSGDRVMEFRNPNTGQFTAQRADDPMYGRLILRSAAAAGGIESATARAAWLDECGQDGFGLDAYEAVLRRLSLARGRVLGTTTPYNLGWLKTEVYDPWKEGDPDIDVIQFDSTMNPAFPEEEFEERRRKMVAWKFNMFYRGRFERPVGLIYDDFIDDYAENGGHKVHPFNIPIDWPRYLGYDPGGANVGKIWWAHDTHNDIFYQYRESLTGGKTTKEHAAEVNELAVQSGENIIRSFVGTSSESQVRRDLKAYDLPGVTGPAVVDVEAGIDRMIELVKERRYFVFDTCTKTIDEFAKYKRVLDENNEPTEQIESKNKFHMLDGNRYLAVGLVKPGKSRKPKAKQMTHTLYDKRRRGRGPG